jgi:hypothetical protein
VVRRALGHIVTLNAIFSQTWVFRCAWGHYFYLLYRSDIVYNLRLTREAVMVEIDEEDALIIRETILSKVIHGMVLARESTTSTEELDEHIDIINDYLCRALGLNPEDDELLEDL